MKALAAMASNRVIGRDGKLPWHLPEDLKWFKKTTLDRPILMGRKTFESLPGLLPRRRHIVLSRSLETAPEGAELIRTIDDLSTLPDLDETELYLVGGANLYEQFLPRCTDLYLSCIHEPHEGDTHFPPFEDDFTLKEVIATHPEFELRHYVNRRRNPSSAHNPM